MKTSARQVVAGLVLLVLITVAACSSDEARFEGDPGFAGEGDDDDVVSQSLAATVQTVYVSTRSRWRCWRAGEDFGTTWRDFEFAPGSHTEATAPLGYGEPYVTNIALGRVPEDQPITAYFRRPFYVQDPAALVSLSLGMMFDDGHVFYINGQEGGRRAMPSGTVTRTTLALGHEATNNVYEARDISSSIGLLRPGWNMLAVEIHQASTTSSDMVFDAYLLGQVMDPPPPPATQPGASEGFSRRSSWRYWDRGCLSGTTWAAPGQDTSSWPNGPGVLGYGESYINTTVSPGPDASNRHITSYFRRDFTVADPALVTAISAEIMFDDGIVVYLNGQRIGSDYMPSGTTTATTLSLGHEAGNAYLPYDWTAQRSRLVAGVNTLAIEVHQASATSSDLVFDASLRVQLATPTSGIARRSAWAYWDRGGALGPQWKTAGFDDSGWARGAGPLGFGESYLGTTVSYGTDASNKHPTTYFRKSFMVDSVAAVSAIRGELMWDDGAVVYLNGQELTRVSMPTGTITATTWAERHEAGNVYTSFDWEAARPFLASGLNVIAVEVHQDDAGSSDLVFDLGLALTVPDLGTTPVFAKYPWNPVERPTGSASGSLDSAFYRDPSVLELGNQLVMYYATQVDSTDRDHHQIVRVSSADGTDWWPSPGTALGLVGSQPSVLRGLNTYRMWYTDDNEAGIRLAVSSDGINQWGQIGMVMTPGAPGAWDDLEVSGPAVVPQGNGFTMWYSGRGTGSPGWHTGRATSTDGVVWIKGPAPVLTNSRNPSVLQESGGLRMWFNIPGITGIWYASSVDGMSWTRGGLSVAAGAPHPLGYHVWDEEVVSGGVMRLASGVLQLYFPSGAGFELGLATLP